MQKSLKNTLSAVAIATAFGGPLAGCGGNVYAPTTIEKGSDAKAKVTVREVVNPGDIPEPFKNCTGTHNVEGYSVQSDDGPSYAVTERNTRKCPPVQLNWRVVDGHLSVQVVLISEEEDGSLDNGG